MMKSSPLLALWVLSVLGPQLAYGQEEMPSYAWLAGSWTGDGFGGTSQEVWSSPDSEGVMMGAYRHYKADGELNFYELLILDETGLRLKHFSADFESWEEKEDYLTFEMIGHDEQELRLKGLVFRQTGADQMEIHLKMKGAGGEVRTEVFHMRRD